MRGGLLRYRVERQAYSQAQDATTGEISKTWVTQDYPQASVEAVSGIEKWRAERVTADCDYLITIRYRAGVDTTQRVKWGTRYFEIKAVLDADGRKRKLELQCKEQP